MTLRASPSHSKQDILWKRKPCDLSVPLIEEVSFLLHGWCNLTPAHDVTQYAWESPKISQLLSFRDTAVVHAFYFIKSPFCCGQHSHEIWCIKPHGSSHPRGSDNHYGGVPHVPCFSLPTTHTCYAITVLSTHYPVLGEGRV